ncbi:MAG: transglutaminase domain-containing protein, partial [Clostridia bacterium]|nr:transglutaminase domain-containing protein [Clostridia bacterium]
MSRPHEWNFKAAVMQYFTALLLSLGMGLSVMTALLPGQAIGPALLWCVLFSLGFHLFFAIRIPHKWLLPLILLTGIAVWGALGGGPGHTLIQIFRALSLTLRGLPDALAPYADALRILVCLLFCLIGAALAWDHTLPLAIFSVLMVICLSFVFGGSEKLLLCALPAAAGLLIMMARQQRASLSPLPVALILALCAFFLVPSGHKTMPVLENAANAIRQFVEDYLFFNEYRTSFSLASEGFMPLEDRLGGEANPNGHSVMEVTCDQTVLLRGKAYDDYSGLNWYDTLSARRYLYLSPRYTALRDELFDLKRPLAPSSLATKTLQVHMLTPATTTLFTPQRTRTLQLDGERMVLYYNLASELFLTRDLQAGDTYTLTYLPYAPGDPATEKIIAACASVQDAHYAQAADQYLTLPRHIQQEIFDIAARATQGANTPYEKALAIQNYLQRNYTYTLKTQTPPEGVDFVAWFLLGEKEGYCTYFATAMTVLCRIMDIPARYVTGFLAVPDESGKALVTGENAHAWVEVYLNGFGWLDFDPTPRSDNDRNPPDESDSPTPPPGGDAPSPSPSPSPSPTPTPQP